MGSANHEHWPPFGVYSPGRILRAGYVDSAVKRSARTVQEVIISLKNRSIMFFILLYSSLRFFIVLLE